MPLFTDDGFANGGWASGLLTELRRIPEYQRRRGTRPLAIVPGWEPRHRIWRGTYQQWIQFEPRDFNGPFFWSGKPAVMSSPTPLYTGYYVERGLPMSHELPEDQTMGPGWHWHGFYRFLSEEPFRTSLNTIFAPLAEMRRIIWVSNSTKGEERPYPFQGESLANTRNYIDSIPPNEWVDVIVGVQHSKDECLNRQKKIMEEIIEALKQGYELYKLVFGAQPPSG